jgi:rubrerythrin
MSKKPGAKDNFRIVVEPRSMTNFGFMSCGRGLIYGCGPEAQARWEREIQERCEELIADMKRHVDNFGSAYIEFDQEHVCEHCGSTWTESSATYNGGCCDKDQEAEDARLVAIGGAA